MLQTMAVMSATHVIVVVLVLVLLFGAQKIPQLMRSMGSGLNEFKKGLKEGEAESLPSVPPPPVEAERK